MELFRVEGCIRIVRASPGALKWGQSSSGASLRGIVLKTHCWVLTRCVEVGLGNPLHLCIESHANHTAFQGQSGGGRSCWLKHNLVCLYSRV